MPSLHTLSTVGVDMIIHIFEFLQAKHVIGTCRRVSKLWLECSHVFPLTVISSKTMKPGVEVCLLPSLTSLTVSKGSDLLDCIKRPSTSLFHNLKLFTCNVSKIDMVSYMTQLTSLDLSGSGLETHGFRTIANTPFSNLQILNLSKNQGKYGLGFIANSPNMRNLTVLNVSENAADETSLLSLANGKHLSNLTWLNVVQLKNLNDEEPEESTLFSRFKETESLPNLNSFASDETRFEYCSPEAVTLFLKQNPSMFHYKLLSPQDPNYRDYVLTAVASNTNLFPELTDDLKMDKEIVLTALRHNANVFNYISESLKDDKQVVLSAVTQDGNNLYKVSSKWKNDKQVVLAAVTQNGNALMHASKGLQNDREIVEKAIAQHGYAMNHVSEELKNDREFVLNAVKLNGTAIAYVPSKWKRDQEIIMNAISQKASVLDLIMEEFKSFKEIKDLVLAAVNQDGTILCSLLFRENHHNHQWNSDREVVLAAVKQNGEALQYAAQELRNDPEIVLTALRKNGKMLWYASKEMKNERVVVLMAVSQYGSALEFAPLKFRKDREVVLAAVSQDGHALKYAAKDLKNDRHIVLTAVKQFGSALEFASDEMKGDRQIVLHAVKQNSHAVTFISSEELKKEVLSRLDVAVQDNDPPKCNLKEFVLHC